MKINLAVMAIAFSVFGVIILQEKPASPKIPSHPLEKAFNEYEKSSKFIIPEDAGTTKEERQKWSVLRDIITCESGARWVVSEIKGVGYDIGPCQIQTKYHVLTAARKGFDLFNPTENMLYCIDLFESNYPAIVSGKGWNPWEATEECWEARQQARYDQ